jgi:hypothetical protein
VYEDGKQTMVGGHGRGRDPHRVVAPVKKKKKTIYICIMAKVCLSVCPTLFLSNSTTKIKLDEMKDVHLSQATLGKLIIVLLCAWVQVKVNLCSNYFFSKKDTGTTTTVGLFPGYGGKTQTIFCCC